MVRKEELPADPIQRFSGRVAHYRRYRPSYPDQIVDLVAARCGLTSKSVMADIGSGTGLLAELFLKRGCRVIGVEPNREMRLAGEERLRRYPDFTSLEGRAEATGLEDSSVDLITVAQALHWFDLEKAKREFRHVLRPGGWVVLIWNVRQLDTTLFLQAYEELLQVFGTDYQESTGGKADQERAQEFFDRGFHRRHFEYRQSLDFNGLKGRLLSCSYVPAEGEQGYDLMLERLGEIFEAHQKQNEVEFLYTTLVYWGRL